MKTVLRLLVSCAIGIGSFIVFFSLFETGIFFSLLSLLISIIGAFLLLSPKKRNPELEKLMAMYGITPEMIKKTIKKGKKKLRRMRHLSKKVENPRVQEQMFKICEITDKIFKNFEYDPKDIKAAREFLNYYLDATVKIIEQYGILSKKKSTKQDEETLEKAEKLLETMEKTFEKQLTRLYEDDFLDLDTEVKVLEKAIKSSGL